MVRGSPSGYASSRWRWSVSASKISHPLSHWWTRMKEPQFLAENIMGLLDSVVGALAGGQSGGNNALLETVMKLINNPQTGGLAGLIQSFQQGGLGDVVNSWVSTGANQPVSPEQIQNVLGNSQL